MDGADNFPDPRGWLMERDQRRGSFWTSLPGILTAIAGMITGTAAIVTATVTLRGEPAPIPTTTPTVTAPAPATPNPSTPTTTTPSTTPTTTTTPTPETAAIDVVYGGDPYGCTLLIQVQIAEVTATQQGLRQTIRDLPVGVQDYQISGQITCPTLGSCNATGEGEVTVQDGREYALVWVNNDIAECKVSLAQ